MKNRKPIDAETGFDISDEFERFEKAKKRIYERTAMVLVGNSVYYISELPGGRRFQLVDARHLRRAGRLDGRCLDPALAGEPRDHGRHD